MIRSRGLVKRFDGHTVLQDVELNVAPGERVALLGLNGAGKTTLIRCLLGLIGFEGELRIAGLDVRSDGRTVRNRIGYVPQRAPHFEGTLAEMVAFIGKLRDAEPATIEERLEALDLSLAQYGAKAVGTLSGGMLQKVLLAVALGSNVDLLLLDEPTANLDARARREFLKAIARVDPQTTVLLASHRIGDVDAVASRLLVLNEGRIAFDGTPDELWAHAGTDVTLWLKVPPDVRSAAREQLRVRCHLTAVLANGAALGVNVDRAARADVIAALRSAEIDVQDFWTESPALEVLLEHAIRTPIDNASVSDVARSVGS